MARDDHDDGKAVPAGRVQRLARFGGLAAGVAGNMATEGVKRAVRGEKVSAQDLLLTPSNATRVADQLSQLRGAAMKVGQLLSMDAGDLIPPELAEILARLRQSAHAMPPQQLRRVLNEAWGRDWLRSFARFDTKPLAAASIGQVHRGQTRDGRDLAIKVQYPGVRQSIDSDVDNVASLIRMTGLLPKGVDLTPLLEEGKKQLKEEADYEREGDYLMRYKEHLSGDDRFAVPDRHADLTTKDVLAMDYMAGRLIDTLTDAPQDARDQAVERLMDLLLRELFTFRLIQTDPNFANYLVQDDGRIVLLDFGATREIAGDLSESYRALLAGAVNGDMEAVRSAALSIGVTGEEVAPEHEGLLTDIFEAVMEPMRTKGPYDFGTSDIATRIRDAGVELRTGGYVQVPQPVTVFIHRKIVGVYLMATRMRARVNVHDLLMPYVR